MTKIGIKNKGNEQKTETNSVDSNPTVSTNILNVKSINTPIKRQIILDCIKKAKTQLYATYKKSTLNIKM